ncbi:MAG: DUF523 domain-containing protein [Deltaproteobacteria bacterium]|nr:DUF523 domain-containing protein [Deltaproteobacteria bacterium]
MFDDGRSKSVIFLAHCILNQNSISDGTASFPGCAKEIVELVSSCNVGIVQMPCPELHCLGLDRGNVLGSSSPVVEENTRIREALGRHAFPDRIRDMARGVVFQISEYLRHGFDIKGVVGINRSPSCGVDTTSKDNQEVAGEGLFIEALRDELQEKAIRVRMVGVKASDMGEAVIIVRELLE